MTVHSAATTVDSLAQVSHPNLLLNAEELAQVQEKIRQYSWAAALFEKAKMLAEQAVAGGDEQALREVALCYALTGEARYGEATRTLLLAIAHRLLPWLEHIESAPNRDDLVWIPMGMYAWVYDLSYPIYADDERVLLEYWLRLAGQKIIAGEKVWTTSRNLVFNKHIAVGLLGYCLGDAELIEWGINDPGTASPPFYVTWGGGGLTQVLDTFIRDGYFWGETPIYALHYDIWGMLALAEAARHYDGADLYHHVSPVTGASIKSLLDGYIRMGYPLERTGIGHGSVRMATYGDGSTCCSVHGVQGDTFLAEGQYRDTRDAGIFYGALEIAYKRYQDPGYAWLLSLNPARDARVVYGGSPWGFLALTHGEPLPEELTPPSAPCGVYPEQGFTMLRADETPAYWTSGALAAVLLLGKYVGHGHADYYSLIVHGKGRLLYPDVNVVQYEAGHLGWTHDGIAHSTLLVDGQSPTHGPFTTRQDFTPEVKFFAISGTAFAGVAQTRAVLMTQDYLADIFQAEDTQGEERTFDWALHGFGRLYPGHPSAYRPTDALVPYYWSVAREHGRRTDAGWQMDWLQRTAGVREGVQFGPEWFEQEAGVRLRMLGAPDTEVYYGEGGLVNGPPNFRVEGNPEGAVPMVVARRRAATATFAAVHEPYEGAARLRQITRVAETPHALAMAVSGPDYTDYLLVAFDEHEHTLTGADGECFTFSNYGYLHFNANHAAIHGEVTAFRVARALVKAEGEVFINDQRTILLVDGDFISIGMNSTALTPLAACDTVDPLEEAAWLHGWTLPDEVHLSAEGDCPARDIALHLRCVGAGIVQGRLRVAAPAALQVEPPFIDIPPLGEGEERVITLTVRASEQATTGLYTLKLVAEEGLQAAPIAVPVSVGVVLSLDRRVPHDMQTVIRAPGYTMKLDHSTGMPSWILDADGQRRYALGNFHTPLLELTNLADGKASGPCGGVWIDDNRLTCLTGPRVAFTVHEDCIVIALAGMPSPDAKWTLTLNNFLDINPPLRTSTATAEISFYPPDYHRQGLLVIAPPRPPDYTGDGFPLQHGEELVLKFAIEDEYHRLTS